MKQFILILGGLFVLFASCSAQLTGQLAQDASGTVQLQAGLEPNMTALIRSLGSLNAGGTVNTQSGQPLLDAAAVNKSLGAAPGVKASSLRNTGRDRIDGTVTVSKIDDLLAAGDRRFIRYEAPAGGAPGRLTIHLDRGLGPRILSYISPEAGDYLSALMAPVATGEALSKKEYLELVASIYGKNIADEIAASTIRAAISFPGQIQSVRGGGFSGREARFETPLADLLVLENPLDYEVVWR
jgi:hypothetical protein